jgi:hypothetical protein
VVAIAWAASAGYLERKPSTVTMPSDHLLELFLDFKWQFEKVRNETARVYRAIGGGKTNRRSFLALGAL